MATDYIIKKSFDPTAFHIDYAKELNAEQLDVVAHGDGPCLVLAGAGSGKTRTIVYRVAYLIEKGVNPNNILLVTFTNKAAKEMLMRVEELLGNYPKGLWGGTFHHIANRILRIYAKKLGFENSFTILDQDDSKDLISNCIKGLKIDPKRIRFPSSAVVQSLISLCKNSGLDMRDVVEQAKPEFVRVEMDLSKVMREYEERKLRNNAMDFDDMLTNLRKLLRDHEDVRQRLSTQFQYILVDEYQDTNHVQDDIVRLLAEVHHNIVVVGDDAQSIYSFRGADISNILEFPKRFSDTRTFRLETNYRSTQPVLDVANEIIRHNVDQFPKKLKHVKEGALRPIIVPAANDEQEGEFIAQRILELRDEGVPLQDIAVLFRAAYHSQALELELTKRDIPYEYRGGLRFFDRAHIKDTLAYLKLLTNPRDEIAFMRVLRLQVGIGDQTASTIFEEVLSRLASEGERHPMEIVFEEYMPPSRATTGWKNFRSTIIALLGERNGSPETLVRLVADSEYHDYLFAQFQDAAERVQDLEQLALFAGKYETVDAFLAEVTLQEDFGVVGGEASNGDKEKIVLSTIHQAKGLEWKAVFVMHLSDLYFPNPRALSEEKGIEEERRLFYVAVTRSEEFLFLTYSITTGYRAMSMQLAKPSPFLTEIPHRLLETYKLSEEAAAEQEELIDPDQVIDLDAEHSSLLDRVMWSNDKKAARKKKSNW